MEVEARPCVASPWTRLVPHFLAVRRLTAATVGNLRYQSQRRSAIPHQGTA